jgi:hypothetical protein
MATSTAHETPNSAVTALLSFVRLALVVAWIANVILVSATWMNAFDGGRMSQLLGPTALLAWILLLGWLGWRTQFRQRAS